MSFWYALIKLCFMSFLHRGAIIRQCKATINKVSGSSGIVATFFVMPFVSLAVSGAFFQLISLFVSVIMTDWLCLLVCVDAVDAVDGCQVTKAIEQAAGAVSGAFSGVACLNLFTFVNIEKLLAFWSCGHLISKSLPTWMLPYYGAIFVLLLTKAHLSPSGTMQQSMKSQACFSVLFVLFVFTLLNVAVSSTTRCQNNTPVISSAFCFHVLVCMDIVWYCMILRDIADYLREWCVDDHRVFCRASNANMFDIDLAYLVFWPLGYVACPKIHCKWMNVNFSEHGMMLQASAVSPVDPGPFGGVACRQGEKMQKDLKGFEFHYDSRCSALWICWRCLNVVLICSDQALFYVVSPQRCNHPAVQRNNQQGLRLLWNCCYIFCDAICFVGSIWRFFPTCFSICFCHSDWLIVLACLCRCCRCGRWISSYKSNRAGSWCSLWGFRWCGLFAFVHICQHWKNWLHSEVAVTWYRSPCWHGCCHIRIASDKGTPITKRYHAAVNEISGLCLFVFTSDECCCFKSPVHFVSMFWYVWILILHDADYLHEWCVDDHRVVGPPMLMFA